MSLALTFWIFVAGRQVFMAPFAERLGDHCFPDAENTQVDIITSNANISCFQDTSMTVYLSHPGRTTRLFVMYVNGP